MATEELPPGSAAGEHVREAMTAVGEAGSSANPNLGGASPADTAAGEREITTHGGEEDRLDELGEGEDGEGEDEDAQGALLGFAVQPQERWSLARWRFPSKCGGVPVCQWNPSVSPCVSVHQASQLEMPIRQTRSLQLSPSL